MTRIGMFSIDRGPSREQLIAHFVWARSDNQGLATIQFDTAIYFPPETDASPPVIEEYQVQVVITALENVSKGDDAPRYEFAFAGRVHSADLRGGLGEYVIGLYDTHMRCGYLEFKDAKARLYFSEQPVTKITDPGYIGADRHQEL